MILFSYILSFEFFPFRSLHVHYSPPFFPLFFPLGENPASYQVVFGEIPDISQMKIEAYCVPWFEVFDIDKSLCSLLAREIFSTL